MTGGTAIGADLRSALTPALPLSTQGRGQSSRFGITIRNSAAHFLPAVTPGQSSVRNGIAGRPALLYSVAGGFFAQA